jgi:hypothetical protein
MPLSRTILIAAGSLLFGVAIGASGARYFMVKANMRVMSITYSEASFLWVSKGGTVYDREKLLEGFGLSPRK